MGSIDELKTEEVILCCIVHFVVHPPSRCSVSGEIFNPQRSRRILARLMLQILQVRFNCYYLGHVSMLSMASSQSKEQVVYHSWEELKGVLSIEGSLGGEIIRQLDQAGYLEFRSLKVTQTSSVPRCSEQVFKGLQNPDDLSRLFEALE